MIGYYVSVIDGQRRGLLLGPYTTRKDALASVDFGQHLAERVDRDAHWYRFGTCRVEAARLPAGRLNRLATRERAA